MKECNQVKYDKLEDLPSLKNGWVRLVHRCIFKDHVDSIKQNGLIFNRVAAQLSPEQKGCSYSNVTLMASVYDETSFWQSLHADNFSCYDNARFADTKIVFDIPLAEFCLLETMGKLIKGKIDSKYIVGCIPNINGANKNLFLAPQEVDKAERISRHNPPLSVQSNNVETMIDELLLKCKSDKKEKIRKIVYKSMQRCKEDLIFDFRSSQNKSKINLCTVMNKELSH